MDLDVYVAAHRQDWERLEALLRSASRPRRLTGEQVDELVELYQRAATHLSVVQSAGRDPALVAKLSSLVARARSAVAGNRQASWSAVAQFLRVDYPATVYRTRWWWLSMAAIFLVVSTAWGVYVVENPEVQASLGTPEQVRQLVEEDFEDYYSSAPAQDFAAQVFTNNLRVAAIMVASGVLLGLPVLYVLYQNAAGVGTTGGLMIANDRAGLFFGLISPHGLLELTAIFIAAGLGLKLGWTVVDPGLRTRSAALAEEGRALVIGTMGLLLMLLVAGLIEGFVTPSGLPTWVRVGIGVVAVATFLTYVFVLGRRAVRAGATGDVRAGLREDVLPSSG